MRNKNKNKNFTTQPKKEKTHKTTTNVSKINQ